MSYLLTYLSLFLAAFLAATIFPAQSEALLSGLLLTHDYSPWVLVVVASVGNVLGAVVNWGLGYQIDRFSGKTWFPFKEEQIGRARRFYLRYGGKWTLLLSWMPFVGDPLTLIAGVMRLPLLTFVSIVTVAKTGRYVAIAWIVLSQ